MHFYRTHTTRARYSGTEIRAWKFRFTLEPWKSITGCSIMTSSQVQDGGRPIIWNSLCRHISAKVICSGPMMKFCVPNQIVTVITRSQAVARIADRILPRSTFGDHVTLSVTWPFDSPYAISHWWSFGSKLLSLTVYEIFNFECNAMVDMTLIRLLNKSQGRSFLYQSISHIRLPIGSQ